MLDRIKTFITKPTSKQVIINTLGNYLNVFFTALFALILVRILNPDQYGVLSVLLGIAYVLANLLDFGTTATIYSYLPPMIENKASNIYQFIKSTFYYQSLFSTCVIAILFITFPWLDRNFFKTGAPPWELYLTAFSVLFLIWQNFILNCLFAGKKFIQANLYLNASNVIKTVIIGILMLTNMINVGTVIFVFGIFGPLVFFLLLYIEKKELVHILAKADVKKEEFRFGYTVTYFIASQFYNLGLRMDLFLLSYFRPKDEVGYYGLAQKIILTVMTTIVSITQVLSPQFSKIITKKDAKHILKTGFLYLLVPTALFLVLVILPDQIFYLFFTEKFSHTAEITHSLGIPFILCSLINLPHLFLLYAVKKPNYLLTAYIMVFLTISIVCWYFIPIYGLLAPPYAITAAFAVAGIILTYGAVREYKKLPVV